MATHDFIKPATANTYPAADASRKQDLTLLWGDRVEVLAQDPANARTQVRARGYPNPKYGPDEVWVKDADLGGEALLDLYFIDVGQGDAVLIVTPDRRHILIDGGYPRRSSPTGKSGADFVDWKFCEEYGDDTIAIDAMIASHCDFDHYGGLADLLDPSQLSGGNVDGDLDATAVTVEAFYHAGLSRWVDPVTGGRTLGSQEPAADGSGDVFVDLLGSRNDLVRHLNGQSSPALQGEWKRFLTQVSQARRRDRRPTAVRQLDASDRYLPGWTPSTGDGVTIRVLGPIQTKSSGGDPGLRDLGGTSINTNGHSVLLRLDYKDSRILLTGDLNKASQHHLLRETAGRWHELSADVTKGCHHGSDDIAFEFLAAIRPGATIISSGDNEGHGHPRPTVVAASALTGHVQFDDHGDLITPLVYSTEIARSVRFGTVTELHVPATATEPTTTVRDQRLRTTQMHYEETRSGDLNPTRSSRPWGKTRVVPGIIYGLVNVRTDGNTILCATRSEKGHRWEISTFPARF